jgi:hypothetical protein
MTKEERLAAAPKMALMKSPDVFYKIRRYASWYYVSPETAIRELRAVGVEITDREVNAFKRQRTELKRIKRERREKLKQKPEIPLPMNPTKHLPILPDTRRGDFHTESPGNKWKNLTEVRAYHETICCRFAYHTA